MTIKFNIDGSINSITGSNIFQYSAGANTIEMQINKPQDSTVTISLVKADGTVLSAKPCLPKTGEDLSAWVYVFGTSGSPDLTVEGDLDIAFTVSKNGVDLNTEHYTGTVQVSYSSGYEPVDPDTATILQALIDNLELNKVARYDVSADMVDYLPANITYSADGEKTPNNVYFDFTNNVIDYDGETREKIGAVLVILNDGVQTELFLTSDGKMYSRTIDGGVTDFVSTAKVDFEFYTYSKLQADNRFVHLSGNETIADTKTFTASPNVPNASANTHAVNRQSMYGYAYSKAEINNLTSPISFDTYAHFVSWLAGGYVRDDGLLPSDLLIGKKIIIQESGQNNYQVAVLPVATIDDFKILVEDNKNLAEISFTPTEDLQTDNANTALLAINTKANENARFSEIETFDIETTDWTDNGSGIYYFDYFSESFTNQTTQKWYWQFNLSNADAQTFVNGDNVYLSNENLYVGGVYGTRIYFQGLPTIDLNVTIGIMSYQNANIPTDLITAEKVGYDNSISGLTATNVKTAFDELTSKKINITDIINSISNYSINKPLSANMGTFLNAKIDNFEKTINWNILQPTDNEIKITDVSSNPNTTQLEQALYTAGYIYQNVFSVNGDGIFLTQLSNSSFYDCNVYLTLPMFLGYGTLKGNKVLKTNANGYLLISNALIKSKIESQNTVGLVYEDCYILIENYDETQSYYQTGMTIRIFSKEQLGMTINQTGTLKSIKVSQI